MEIIEMAQALGEAIKADGRMARFQKAKEAYDADEKLVAAVKEYNVQKMALNEHLKDENRDEAVTDAIQRRIEEICNEICASPVMIEYNEAEKALNDFIGLVNMAISCAITGEEMGCTEEKCKTCSGCRH
ncbi:MAG: YlbF family regulator [Ruminococcaceae bacterium]|nr:YlbF family regulator [Oscillospiraceae bacterium]